MGKRRGKRREAEEERAGLRERICRGLDIPPDLLPGAGLLELRGEHSVTVKGCGKILVYTPEEICVEWGRGSLSVRGERLVCTSYFSGTVGVDGLICSVVLGSAGERKNKNGKNGRKEVGGA